MMVPIAESASMLWARVIRGIKSIEKAVISFSARLCINFGSESGSKKAIKPWPERIWAKSLAQKAGFAPPART
jgi:hypothetical protein